MHFKLSFIAQFYILNVNRFFTFKMQRKIPIYLLFVASLTHFPRHKKFTFLRNWDKITRRHWKHPFFLFISVSDFQNTPNFEIFLFNIFLSFFDKNILTLFKNCFIVNTSRD